MNSDCWPLSLPPTLMRSVTTPGADCQHRPGIAGRRGLLEVRQGHDLGLPLLAGIEQRRAVADHVDGVALMTDGCRISTLVLRPMLTETPVFSIGAKPSISALTA